MRGFKAINLFFILLFPMTLIGADNRLTVYGGNAQSQDVAALQKIVLRMVMGLQKQEPYLVYKHFQPGPNSGLKNPGTELESLKGTLNALCRAFDHRSRINKPSDDVSNTFDFIDLKKDVHLAQDGNSAWVDLELGFYSLPGNPEVLRNLPSEVVGAMTESEKEMKNLLLEFFPKSFSERFCQMHLSKPFHQVKADRFA